MTQWGGWHTLRLYVARFSNVAGILFFAREYTGYCPSRLTSLDTPKPNTDDVRRLQVLQKQSARGVKREAGASYSSNNCYDNSGTAPATVNELTIGKMPLCSSTGRRRSGYNHSWVRRPAWSNKRVLRRAMRVECLLYFPEIYSSHYLPQFFQSWCAGVHLKEGRKIKWRKYRYDLLPF